MAKAPDAFRTISEVAEWLGVQAHVLRFWESKFSQVKPVKRAGGRRYYRPADMLLLGGIKKLLHDDGLTIKGVQKILKEEGIDHVAQQSQELEAESNADAAAPEQTDSADNIVSLQQGVPDPDMTEAEAAPSEEPLSEAPQSEAAAPIADEVSSAPETDHDMDDWTNVPQPEQVAEPAPVLDAESDNGAGNWSLPELPEAHAPLIGIPDDMRPAEDEDPMPEEIHAEDSLPASLLDADDSSTHSAPDAPAGETETPSLFSRRMPQAADDPAQPDPTELTAADDQPDLLSAAEIAEPAPLPAEDTEPQEMTAEDEPAQSSGADAVEQPLEGTQPSVEDPAVAETVATDDGAAMMDPADEAPDDADPQDSAAQDTQPQDVAPQDTGPQDSGSAALPSFLTRPEEPSAPEAEAPRAREIEVDDPPQDDDLSPAPGILSHLAQIDRLSAEQAQALAPLAEDLRTVSARILQRSSG